MLHKNVTPSTTGSSPEHNGLPNATNVQRLAEIRARLDAATPGPWRVIEPLQQTTRPPSRMLVADLEARQQSSEIGNVQMSWVDTRFITHAPSDIAWLLALAEALIEQIEFLKDDVSRIAAQRDRYKKRWHGESA